ncbi:hypothetical protein D1872_293900 [compost metagenome]
MLYAFGQRERGGGPVFGRVLRLGLFGRKGRKVRRLQAQRVPDGTGDEAQGEKGNADE